MVIRRLNEKHNLKDIRAELGLSIPSALLSFKTRFIFGAISTAIMIVVIKQFLFPNDPFTWGDPLFLFLVLFIISEGIFIFNQFIAKRYPWHRKVRKRIVLLLLFSTIWFIAWVILALHIRPYLYSDFVMESNQLYLSLTFFMLFVLNYVFLLIVYNYHQSLTAVVLDNEQLKQERLRQDYVALQDQINPHFLFNNISTLIAVIKTNPDLAVKMAEDVSDVYRYVLQSKERLSVSLDEELKFAKSYLALHKVRLGEGLQVTYSVDDRLLDYQVAPLCLQFLVENAIKHNIATLSSPLIITLKAQGGHVSVTNSYNPKKTTYSTNTGLKNLKKRYLFLTSESIVVEQNDKYFGVTLPLINSIDGN